MRLPILTELIFSCFAFALFSSFAQAATISYHAIDHQYFYSFNISGITASPGGRFPNRSSGSYVKATLDPSSLEFQVDEVQVDFEGVSKQFTENFTINLGEVVELNVDLRVRPFSFRATGGRPSTLTPLTDGYFSLNQGFFTATSYEADPIGIDYTITGPTETVHGSTGEVVFTRGASSNAILEYEGRLNANGFPNSLSLESVVINAGFPTPSSIPIDVPIEGGTARIVVGFGYLNIDNDLGGTGSRNPITLVQIPEPETLSLLFLGLIAFSVRTRSHIR